MASTSLNRSKPCSKCGGEKTPYQSKGKDPVRYVCKPCRRINNRKYYELYPHRWKPRTTEQIRRTELKTKYGISLEEYEALLEKQHGVCSLCNEVCKTGRRLAVDHNHETGQVRGLLCRNCNQFLGRIESNNEWLAKAANYLGVQHFPK